MHVCCMKTIICYGELNLCNKTIFKTVELHIKSLIRDFLVTLICEL